MKTNLFLLVIAMFVALSSAAQVDASLFRYTDVSELKIAFVYAGDIWLVDKDGGQASRLSSPEGEEVKPKFSPDGQTLAFSANYDGSMDVYTVPVNGGLPQRITWRGSIVTDWHPSGEKIMFATSKESGRQRFSRLFTIDKDGGLPEVLPPAYAEVGVFSPDGKYLAFTDKSRLNRTWKRYRGGMAPDIYVMNLEDYTTQNITNNNASDELPMWSENKIYYLSDNGPEKRYNIWCYNVDSKTNRQVTDFSEFDVHFPSIGPDDLVFEAGGDLYLMNLSTEETKQVEITVLTDQMASMPKNVKVNKYLIGADISPDGNRVIAEARGEVFSLPAEKGFILNLTQSSGVAERSPAWSPDGKTIAWWSDASGEYELTLYDVEKETSKTVTSLGPGFRYDLYWSPNSKKLAFIDQTMSIKVCDVESGEVKEIDKALWMMHGPLQGFSVSWSSDSRYVTWSRGVENRNSVVFIYDVQENQKHAVTSEFYSNTSPTFDPDGKYLYVITNRSMTPDYSDFDNTFIYSKSSQIAAISLQKDTPSPIEPENDRVEIKEDEDNNGDKETEEKDESEEEEEAINTDFDGLEQRLVILPVDAGNYQSLAATKGKVIFHDLTNTSGENAKRPVVYWDLKDRELKTIIDNADGFVIAANGEKMLVMSKGQLSVIGVNENQKAEKFVPLQDMEMNVVPKEEWKQLFADAWRIERDYFYDKNMHGLDWNALKKKYGELIEQAASREDVNFILGELIGEMNASHTYKGGGDLEQAPRQKTGYLGVDWAISDGAYRIKNILKGAKWDAEARSPLAEPGVDVEEGDYILKVNGLPLSVDNEPAAAFQGLGGKTVELTVSKTTSEADAIKVVVKLLDDESRLRHLAWIEAKRQRVDEATDGKVGYIYVRSTGIDGQNELARQFYGQWNKDGLIIDERFNSGGQIPDRFIELLNRKALAYWAVRDGHDWQWPPVGHFGPKVMLINGWSGSGGDAFPDYFRKAELGPLVGSRTWGGLIGISGTPSLIDGGNVTAPTFRMYDPDGKWFLEGHGVDPDVPVAEDHEKLAKGIDNQLEKAIEIVKDQLQKNPVSWPKHEPYESR
ncbi:S41 family peptidase [Maribellus mangrovi]|uniref:S41 family peptidase n=1 Tax=Maribellus mangrovi TaxID=3133146 RepID=UPI0030EF6540